MPKLIRLRTTRLGRGDAAGVVADAWINLDQVVRIDPYDSRTRHDGELALFITLADGSELYVPIDAPPGKETAEAAADAILQLFCGDQGEPIVAFEFD